MNPPSVELGCTLIDIDDNRTEVIGEHWLYDEITSVSHILFSAPSDLDDTEIQISDVEISENLLIEETYIENHRMIVLLAIVSGNGYNGSASIRFNFEGIEYEGNVTWDWIGRPIKLRMNDPHGGPYIDYPFVESSGNYSAAVPLAVEPYDIALFFVGDTSQLTLVAKSNLGQDIVSGWVCYADGGNTKYTGRSAAGATDFPWTISLGSDYPSVQVVQ